MKRTGPARRSTAAARRTVRADWTRIGRRGEDPIRASRARRTIRHDGQTRTSSLLVFFFLLLTPSSLRDEYSFELLTNGEERRWGGGRWPLKFARDFLRGRKRDANTSVSFRITSRGEFPARRRLNQFFATDENLFPANIAHRFSGSIPPAKQSDEFERRERKVSGERRVARYGALLTRRVRLSSVGASLSQGVSVPRKKISGIRALRGRTPTLPEHRAPARSRARGTLTQSH